MKNKDMKAIMEEWRGYTAAAIAPLTEQRLRQLAGL